MALGERQGLVGEVAAHRPVAAQLLGQPAPRGVRVEADHAAAARPEHLHGQDAHEAKADDRDRLAEAHLALAHALQRDCADRRARGVRETHAVGNPGDQVARHGIAFGVVREARAAAGHAVADGEPAVAPGFDDDARAGIAEGNGLVELRLHLLQRREDPLGLHLAQNLPDLIGHLQRLADQALPGEFGEHALRPRAHEARRRQHDRALRRAQRRRHVRQPHLAGLERL